MDEDRALQAGSRLELGQQAVDVVDVPGPFDLGDHHDLEPVADLAHDPGQVVQHPWRLERVDAGPQRGLAQIHLPADPDQPLARGLLAVDRHRVLEVAEQDVGLGRDVGGLGHHLLVGEVEEVDHPRRLEGDLGQRIGRPDGLGLEEVARIAHEAAERTAADSGQVPGRSGVGAPMRRLIPAALAALALAAPADAPAVGDLHGRAGGRDSLDARGGAVAPSAAQRAVVERMDARASWNRFGAPRSLFRDGGWLAEGLPGRAGRGRTRVRAPQRRAVPALGGRRRGARAARRPPAHGHRRPRRPVPPARRRPARGGRRPALGRHRRRSRRLRLRLARRSGRAAGRPAAERPGGLAAGGARRRREGRRGRRA